MVQEEKQEPQLSMPELVVYDQLAPCPYLPGEVARMPLRQPFRLSAAAFDQLLAAGNRRTGQFLYRTECPTCRACEPIRVPIAEFTPVRTQKRTLRKGDELLTLRIGPPQCDAQRVDLYNRHKRGRGLALRDDEADAEGYRQFLVLSCVPTLELSYWHGERLVAVAISDRGAKTFNAVYCYFDPEFQQLGLGTYNVLKQIELCRQWQLTYLYLGLYIAASPHMNYKARYLPHERLIEGVWRRFERDG